MTPSIPCPVSIAMRWVFSSSDSADDPAPLHAAARETGMPLLQGKRVVIVEDEGITQIQLRKICISAGMNVVATAADGQEAVQRVLETRPDVVIMDIKMPVLDGLSAAERILKELSVCVVMLTAYDLEDYKQRARNLGASGYIIKPVTGASLIPKLESAYRAFQSPPQ